MQRKILEDYFRIRTVCIKCQKLMETKLEESEVPYHHQMLKLKYSNAYTESIFNNQVFQNLIVHQGEFLNLTHEKTLDASIMALLMDSPIYLNHYLTLDFITYFILLESIPVVLITE